MFEIYNKTGRCSTESTPYTYTSVRDFLGSFPHCTEVAANAFPGVPVQVSLGKTDINISDIGENKFPVTLSHRWRVGVWPMGGDGERGWGGNHDYMQVSVYWRDDHTLL